MVARNKYERLIISFVTLDTYLEVAKRFHGGLAHTLLLELVRREDVRTSLW
jgi:hypothetical protein